MLKLNLKAVFALICVCCTLSACKKDHQDSENEPCDGQPVFEWKKPVIVTDGADGNFNFTLATDKTGNVYVASKINGSVDADPGDEVWEVHTNGVVLQKFNAEGKLVWASVVDAPVVGMHLDALKLVFDTQLNIYLYTSYSSSPYQFGRITRFDEQGNVNNASDHQYGDFLLALDKQGNRYDIGFENKLTIMNGNNLVIEKSTVDDPGFSAGIIDLQISPNGNIYLLGRLFNKDANFDPGNEAHIKLTEQPTADKPAMFYVQKLDAKTNFLWVTQVGIANYTGPVNMLIDKMDNVYVNSVNDNDWRYNTLRKLANDGILVWQKQVIKSGSIMFDGEDNLYVDGYLQWERYSTLSGELTWSTFADAAYNGHVISTGDGRTMYSLTPELITSSNYTKATISLRKYTFCGR